MINRMEWAHKRKDIYLDWCDKLNNSPYTPLDKLEFALISAHTSYAPTAIAFRATRGLTGVGEIADELDRAGVVGPLRKSVLIQDLRESMEFTPYPVPDLREYRRTNKLPGLGHCKLSFGIALMYPLSTPCICIDTHIAQIYGVDNTSRLYRKLDEYEAVEAKLETDAKQLDMPLFAAQWAFWDWHRLVQHQQPPNDHRALWDIEQLDVQIPLFSSMEGKVYDA